MVINHSNVLRALGVAGVVVVARPAYAAGVDASAGVDRPAATVASSIAAAATPPVDPVRATRRVLD